jgi:hypothetical protein
MSLRDAAVERWRRLPDTMFVLAQRAWLSGSGLITAAVVAYTLTPAEQGWYYAFLSISSVSILFDLGLSALLVQVVAKETIGLKLTGSGRFIGDGAPRLAGFLKGIWRRYQVSALACLLLIPIGLIVFRGRASTLTFNWVPSWLAVVLATGVGQAALPWPFVLEGSSLVREAYLVRLVQGLIGSVGLWLALLLGASIYAVAMRPLAAAVVVGAWFMTGRRGLSAQALMGRVEDYPWRERIQGLHGRTAVSWIAGYLLMHLYVPVLFSISGPAAAGQLGLSVTIANTLALVAQSWITSSFPALAKATAEHAWLRMDRLFRRAALVGVVLYLVGAALVMIGDWALAGTRFAQRLLPPSDMALLLLGFFGTHLATLVETKVRAYRRDPFAWNAAICGVVTLLLVVPAARIGGSLGVILLSTMTSVSIRLPWSAWLFVRANREWRVTSPS